MIEQLMKAVKRGSKKKSLNVTIAIAIGFLLSCLPVMGEGLEITQETGKEILFNGETYDKATHPFKENIFKNNVYTNNTKIEMNGQLGLAIELEEDLKLGIYNNGSISGVNIDGFGYGIYNAKLGVEKIENNGIVLGTGKKGGVGIENNENIGEVNNSGKILGVILNQSIRSDFISSGIRNFGNIDEINNTGLILGNGETGTGIMNFRSTANIEEIKNKGIIIGQGGKDQGAGIDNYQGKLNKLENMGEITGISSEAFSYGITSSGSVSEIAIDNLGMISGITKPQGIGATQGRGLYFESNTKNIINNIGIVCGTTSAVYKSFSASVKVEGNNYGLLLNQNDATSPVDMVTIDNAGTGDPEIKNYGIVFKVKSDGKYDVSYRYIGSEDIDVKMFSNERQMKVKNAVTSETGSNSFSEKTYENSIINGITDTIKISGTGNTIKGSVVNAYTSAIKFDETENNSLTVSGSVINGGLDDNGIAIKGSSKNDELILESGEIKFKDGSIEKINTVINGDIDLGDGDNKLAISDGTIINGEILSGTGTSSLVLGKQNITKETVKAEINISNNIKGFDETSIHGNVTISDKTHVVKNDLSVVEEKLTAELGNITLENGSVLVLKIDGTEKNNNKIIGHALYDNTGSIASNGGKLLLDVGKLSDGSIVNFGKTELTDSIKGNEINYSSDITLDSLSLLHDIEKLSSEDVLIKAKKELPTMPYPDDINYYQLNKVYKGILSTDQIKYFNVVSQENLSALLGYLNDVYAGNPYSYSSELSRKSMGIFRDIITENLFKADTGKWMIYGGLTHIDGGTKDTYYGKGYYTYDIGSSDIDADTKITGAYMLGEYGVSDDFKAGVAVGGNKLKSDLSNGSKAEGNAMYIGGYTKKYIGNLKVTAGMGFQYGNYDVDRLAINNVASDIAEPVMKYSDNYNDISYDIYLNGRYFHSIGDNLYLEPYGTLSYTYVKQDGADEENKTLAIETDSKSFDYTSAKVGLDLKKVIPHEKGKSTLSVGASYTRLLNGADEEYITGRFKGGSDFDILVAHKNEHSLGLNAKYTLELENGILFDVKGSYAVERDSHNQSGKNKTKGEWIVGTGLGYKF
ncbi:autotransporter outer membrane beta-barrel domain-containing protein [Fusobacterium varium]|uniref:autotransporter family protein n=1 Tax=Fusobacterium varium TaxID=856 RepID=UPI0035685F2E